MAIEDLGVASRASKEVDRGSRLKHLPFTKKGSRPAPEASKKGRWELERRRGPGTGVEDLVPWVAPISTLSLASKEEEEEDEMADLIHNFGARKRKRGANFKRATDATPKVIGEANQHSARGGFEDQAIVVTDSPRWAFTANRLWRLLTD